MLPCPLQAWILVYQQLEYTSPHRPTLSKGPLEVGFLPSSTSLDATCHEGHYNIWEIGKYEYTINILGSIE